MEDMGEVKCRLKTAFCLFVILFAWTFLEGVTIQMKENRIHLPTAVGVWTRTGPPKMVDATNIFDYMDGAGELYLGYRFDRLEVYTYDTDDSLNSILVELYFMASPDDAFGLLSLDWGGEPVVLSRSSGEGDEGWIAPPSRALYGGGLLRMCSGSVYARVMAYRETTASKEAVLSLGRAIAVSGVPPSEPALFRVFPRTLESGWTLQNDRMGYFRSYLVLNSLYYVSHENILDLDRSVEAVTAPYVKQIRAGEQKRIQVLLVKYASAEQGQEALHHFVGVYLSEYEEAGDECSEVRDAHSYKVEDGWLGYRREERFITIVFECPDPECVREVVNQISGNRKN